MKKLIFSLLTSLSLCAMERNNSYYVPAVAQKELTHITEEQLSAILPDDQLSSQGVITSLVVRPQEHYRTLVNELVITPEGIEGDKHVNSKPHYALDVVTLMRSDVSDALGGAHVPGDNIHVKGMKLSKKNIKAGDLVIVKNQSTIKAVLLKTHIPHYACWKLTARCGKTAFDFLNAEGNFLNGYGSIHGLRDRLRGIRLSVLKSDEPVRIGDLVAIATKEQKDLILADSQIHGEYQKLLSMSIEVGNTLKKQEKAKRALRNK
ncbi:MAG: hypothetical protein ACOYT8_03990 [Candidatus Dependentiae bacterium]